MINRDDRLSYLRAFACIAIVVLHTFYIANGTFTESYALAGNIVSNVIRNLMLWAVPTFLMITGTLSLNLTKDLSIQKIFSKNITRVFLALVIFCVIYQVFDSIFIDKNFGIGSIFVGIKEALLDESWSTMWYLYQLIGLYLLLPIYRLISKHAKPIHLQYLLFLYFIFLTIIPMLRIFGINLGFTINTATIYPFYFFMGYSLYSGTINISKRTGKLLVIIGSLLTVLLTAIRYMADLEVLELFRNYNGLNVVLQSIGVFAWIFGGGKDNYAREIHTEASSGSTGETTIIGTPLISRIILNLDENSFGVYLIHIILIKWLFRVANYDPYNHLAGFSFIWIVIALTLISWLITWILRLIPFVRKVL